MGFLGRIPLAIVALTVAAPMALASGEAAASHVSCGDTLTADTTLDSDLDCAGLSGSATALTIGADGVTLDLNGHMVSATCMSDCSGTAVIADRAGYDGVHIMNGQVQVNDVNVGLALTDVDASVVEGLGFTYDGDLDFTGTGIALVRSDDNRLANITSSKLIRAVSLSDSDGNVISEGGFSVYAGYGDEAIRVANGSDRNRIADTGASGESAGLTIEDSVGNRVARSDLAGDVGMVGFHSDRTVIVKNSLGRGPTDAALLVTGDSNRIRSNDAEGIYISGDRNRVVLNQVPFPDVGIFLRHGDANRVRENTVTADPGSFSSRDGIRVGRPAGHARVQGNVISGFNGDGIDVNARGTVVRDNTATDNDDLGIEAVAGVIDGGGNLASGNGNPLQCRNVVCT